MSNLLLKKINTGCYTVCYENNVYLGQFICGIDGFYDFWPKENSTGCYPEHLLLSLHLELKELNKEWNTKINKYFDK